MPGRTVLIDPTWSAMLVLNSARCCTASLVLGLVAMSSAGCAERAWAQARDASLDTHHDVADGRGP